MIINNNIEINSEAVEYTLKKITNQVYKLLPTREEGNDWEKPLETIFEELAGMSMFFSTEHKIFFPLLCKLEGLLVLSDELSFSLFRRTIFECLSLCNQLKKICLEKH